MVIALCIHHIENTIACDMCDTHLIAVAGEVASSGGDGGGALFNLEALEVSGEGEDGCDKDGEEEEE